MKASKTRLFREVPMSTAYEFLKANQVFHLATVDGTKAKGEALRLCHEKEQ